MASSLRVSHHNSRQASVGNLTSHLGAGMSNGSNSSTRPVSEIFPPSHHHHQNDDSMGQAARQWIDKIEEFESTLNEMAAAALDSDFKKELTAIEQWFRVLNEAERTAALYALLQQTTQVQIRFFIQVLQQMGQQHPMSAALSPSGFPDREPMNQQFADAFSRLNVDSTRGPATASAAPPSPSLKRAPTVDSSTINSMFPDAAAVVAQQKAVRSQAALSSVHSNTVANPVRDYGALQDGPLSPQPLRPNTSHSSTNRPRSSLGLSMRGSQPPMSASALVGGFGLASIASNNATPTTLTSNPPPTGGGLMSARPVMPAHVAQRIPHKTGSWASMTNTPVTATFPSISAVQQIQQAAIPLTTTASFKPIALQAPPKGKFGTSTRPQSPATTQPLNSQTLNSAMMSGMLLPATHLSEMQINAMNTIGHTISQPTSPALLPGGFDPFRSSNLLNSLIQSPAPLTPLPSIQLHQPGSMAGPLMSPSLYMDSGDGFGPRRMVSNGMLNSRRGVMKPPEDPTDPSLLSDVPAWLRSLRLHKYTDNLKDIPWQQMVDMDEAALEERGVNALGARRKMLKAFEQVKEAQAQGRI